MTTEEFLALFPGSHWYATKIGSSWREQGITPLNPKWLGDVYFTVNETDGVSRKSAHISRIRAIWVEADVKVKRKFPIPPTITVESSPGKHHYYWIITDNLDRDVFNSVMARMVQDYNCDSNAKDISRVLRVPGTVNYKYTSRPEVTILPTSNPTYTAQDILTAFPPVPIVPIDNVTNISTAKKFSVKNAITNILTGEDVHGSRVSLAMHWANSGMPKEDALETLIGYVEDAMRSNTVTNGRAMARLSNMKQAVESAYKKKDAEMDIPYDRMNEDEKIYTNLPLPIGGLKVITDEALRFMSYPSKDMAVVIAQHVISVFGGGLFRLHSFTTTRKRTILAKTGRGKSVAGDFMSEIVRRMAINTEYDLVDPYPYIGADSYSKTTAYHSDLYDHRVRSYIMAEAGVLGKSTAGTLAEDRAYILNLLTTTYKKEVKAKQMSNRTSDNRKVNERLKPLYGVVAVFLSESVPESYSEILHSMDAFRSGDIGREEIVFINPHVPKRNKEANGDIASLVINMMTILAKTFEQTAYVEGNNPANPDKFIAIDVSQIDDLLDGLADYYVDKRNKTSGDYVQEGILPRLWERVVGTILVQAIADEALRAVKTQTELQTPVATEEHYEFAIAYQSELARSLTSQSTTGSLADPFELCMHKLEKACYNFGTIKRDRDQPWWKEGIVSSTWISKVLDKSKVPAVAALLRQKNGSRGAVNREIVEHAERVGMFQSVASVGKVNRWKINKKLTEQLLKEVAK